MARLRVIKPEFWDDEKLATISRDARLTFIGIWNNADDYGVVKGHTLWLKNNIYPYDDIKNQTFQGWLSELESIRVVTPFTVNDEKYYYIKNFLKHQTINRPSQTRNPNPPDNINDDSLSNHGVLTSEVEVEVEVEREVEEKRKASPRTSDSDFISQLKEIYTWIDVDTEIQKMKAWFLTPKGKGRRLTQRFAVNWLNKIDKPIQEEKPKQSGPKAKYQCDICGQPHELGKGCAYGEKAPNDTKKPGTGDASSIVAAVTGKIGSP